MGDEWYRGVRVAVLGASGFIGRWVSRGLSAHGASLCLVVRDRSKAEDVFDLFAVRGDIVTVDLRAFARVRACLEEIRPSVVFNLAGYGVDRSERDEEAAYEINADLVEVVCNAVARTRDPSWPGQDIVHVGSAAECGPPTAYGRSKLAGTQIMQQQGEGQRIKGVTARLFTVYGPGEHQGRLLPSLLEAAGTGQPVPLTAGHQVRDFTYVEDVAEGLLRLGKVSTREDGPINLATGRLVTVRQFIETAASILSIPAGRLRFDALPMRDNELTHGPVSLERLHRAVAWVPQTTVDEGVRRTWAFEQEGRAI